MDPGCWYTEALVLHCTPRTLRTVGVPKLSALEHILKKYGPLLQISIRVPGQDR